MVSQWINSVFLHGIPLFSPPPGRFATILIDIIGGGALGFLVTWPEEFLTGVLISAVSGTLFSSLMSLRTESGDLERMFGASVVLFITFLPRVLFFLPLVFLVRWVVNIWEKETLYTPYSFRGRFRSVLLLAVVGLAAGLFSLYPRETRMAMKNLNALILEGRQASSPSSLPQPLQNVNDFLKYSNTPYTFKLISNPEVIPIPRSITGFNQNETDIEVNFANGFRFGCVYTQTNEQPNCIDY
jgi:hypothetical protein